MKERTTQWDGENPNFRSANDKLGDLNKFPSLWP